MGGSPTKIPKDEDEKEGEKNGPGQNAQDDLDDMEITKLWMFVCSERVFLRRELWGMKQEC